MALISRFLLFVSLLVAYSVVNAERYSVEEDSFGHFSAQKVEDEQVVKSPAAPADTSVPVESIVPVDSAATVDSRASSGSIDPAVNPGERKISIFEQKFLEAERKAKADVVRELTGERGASDYDATEVNPVNFIDGDDLVTHGGIRDVNKAPYYITTDADGSQHTTFYDPVSVKEALDKQKENKITYTSAQILKREGSEAVDLSVSLDGVDPIAAGILGLGGDSPIKTHFDIFSETCCASLPNQDAPDITIGKYHYFTLTQDDLPYRFSEGDSRYLLLSLPGNKGKNFPLRLRTFIRKHNAHNIENGVFFPQLITLDKDKNPLRMFTGPLLQYHEETWASHGYLEGVFQINRPGSEGEWYLLVNTTREALKQSSTIDGEEGAITIEHMGVGDFEIQILVEQ